MKTIQTDRLILTPVSEASLPIYQEVLGSDALTTYLPKGEAYTDAEIRAHLDNRIKHWAHGFGSYAIYAAINTTNGECLLDAPIGYVGVEHCPNPDYSDIRYAMSPTVQGKGYVQEASQAVLSETFKLGKHDKIYGVSLVDNAASMAILRKLGMTPEPDVFPYGEHEGLLTFSIANNI